MDVQDFFDYLNSQTILGISLSTILSIVVITVIAFTLERVTSRYLKSFARRNKLDLSVQNRLVLTSRILILIGAAAAMLRIGALTTEWFVAFSALGGAAVGFASSQSIGNFIAGLYLLASQPFKVGDYVRVGTVEGIVQEITINFTKILTIGNNVVSILNLQVLQRDLTNYQYEDEEGSRLCCYTFEMGFDHSVDADKIAEIYKKVFEQHEHVFAKRPLYMIVRSSSFERVYMVYLYVKNPQDIFVLRPRIAEEAFKLWDVERKRKDA